MKYSSRLIEELLLFIMGQIINFGIFRYFSGAIINNFSKILILTCVLSWFNFDLHAQELSQIQSPNTQAVLSYDLPAPDSLINVLERGADNSAIKSSDSVLQKIIEEHNGNPVVIYFPTGTYLFNQTIKLKSNIILRGLHSDSTELIFDLGGSKHSIQANGSLDANNPSYIKSVRQSEQTIQLESGLAKEGQTMFLCQDDSSWITSSWAKNSVGQFIDINIVEGNKAILEQALRHSYYEELEPRLYQLDFIENVGIENLKVTRRDMTSQQTSNILLKYARNCWVYGVHFDSANFAHITIERSYKNLVTGSFFENAFDYGGGGKAYGVVLQFTSSENTIENNIFQNLRHSMLLQAGANGNILAYNYSKKANWTSNFFPSSYSGDLVLHGNYVYANLLEGNVVQNIVIDNSHGMNGPRNVFLRNRAEHAGLFMNASQTSDSQIFIGNEITSSGNLIHKGFPFPKGMYSLAGRGHFEYGNNHNGKFIPSPIQSLSHSYYLNGTPSFWDIANSWPSIGYPNDLGAESIPAEYRYNRNKRTVKRSTSTKPLIIFNLVAKQNYVNRISLNWNINSDVMLNYFEVLKYTNDKEYVKLGVVQPSINSPDKLFFSFEDTKPLIGENKYQIKHIAKDGNVKYSNVFTYHYQKASGVEVVSEVGAKELSLYFDNPKLNSSKISIYSMSGKELLSKTLSKFQSNLTIDMSPFPTGIYNVIVVQDGYYFNQKIANP